MLFTLIIYGSVGATTTPSFCDDGTITVTTDVTFTDYRRMACGTATLTNKAALSTLATLTPNRPRIGQ